MTTFGSLPARAAETRGTPMAGEMYVPKESDLLSIDGLLRLLRIHKWLIAGSVVFVVALVAAVCVAMSPTYEAMASVQVVPTKVDLPNLFATVTNDREVATNIEVLQSRRLATSVIDSLGLRAVVRPARVLRSQLFTRFVIDPKIDSASYEFASAGGADFTIKNLHTDSLIGRTSVGKPIILPGLSATLTAAAAAQGVVSVTVRPQEVAYLDFAKRLRVERPVREGDVISIGYRGKDPQLVRDVPNLLAANFISDHQSTQKVQARSTVKVLRAQLDSLSKELKTSETALQSFREANQVVSLPEEATTQVQQYAQLAATRSAMDIERRSLSSLVEEVKAEAAAAAPGTPSPYRRLIAFPSLLKNVAATSLLNSLATVDEERTKLLTRRTAADPDVEMLTSREQQIEEQIRNVATTYLQGLTDQTASMKSALGASQAQLGRIPAKEIAFARLSRTPKVLDTIYVALQTRLREAQVAQAVDDPSLLLMDPAVQPVEPIRPKPKLYLPAAMLLGLLIGLGVAQVRDGRDRTVHTRFDLLSATGAPVLGLIPKIGKGDTLTERLRSAKKLGSPAQSSRRNERHERTVPFSAKILSLDVAQGSPADLARAAVTEAYSRLQTNLAFAHDGGTLKTLVVTSPLPGDGKTTSAIHLSMALAAQGHRVLLVDGDLRRGIINRIFGVSRTPGLINVLAGTTTARAAIRTVNVGRGFSLDYLTTGDLRSTEPGAALDASAWQAVLAELAKGHDRIIIDSPPVNVVSDAAVLAAHADGVLIVARSGITATRALTLAMDQLRHVRATVLGAVLNDIDFARDVAYDESYRFEGAAYNAYDVQES